MSLRLRLAALAAAVTAVATATTTTTTTSVLASPGASTGAPTTTAAADTAAPTSAPTAPPTMLMLVGSFYENGCAAAATASSMYAPDGACVPFEDNKFFGIDCATQEFHLFDQPNCTDVGMAVSSYPFTCAVLEPDEDHPSTTLPSYGFKCVSYPSAHILQWTFRKGGCDDDEAEESTVYYVELDTCQRPPNWELGDHDLGTRSFKFSTHGVYPNVNVTASFWPSDGTCTGSPDRVIDLPLDVVGGTRETCREDDNGEDSAFERLRRLVGTARKPFSLGTFMGANTRSLVGAGSSSFKLVGNPKAAPNVKTARPTKRPTKRPTPPTKKPTKAPTTKKPTATPTKKPTKAPTNKPTTRAPTTRPTKPIG